MKRFFNLLVLAAFLSVVTINTLFAQQAKYVFYFIGDGMGLNQVNGTEMYLAELEGKIGITSLCFTGFPVASFATSFSGTNSVTDSSAAGTALATGYKTKNGAVGVTKEDENIYSVAVLAKNAGKKVGVATSVSIDHATPASFYAHQPKRSMYFEIANDLPKANFDFYAGSGFLQPTSGSENVFDLFKKTGYTVAKGYNDFLMKYQQQDKIILTQEDGKYVSALKYAIDRREGDNELSLSQITESAIRFLSKDEDNGFFLMVEGGKIDWACHGNDVATTFHEVIDMDNAVRLAYQFYEQHPDETLIVVTADHETGGLGLGSGHYELNLKILANQKISQGRLSELIRNLRITTKNNVSWDDIKTLLKDNMGFWNTVKLTGEQEKRIKDEYNHSFSGEIVKLKESEYEKDEPMAALAKDIMNEIALVKWCSGGHSASYIPIFAIGAGAEHFNGRMDNTDIPKRIAKAAGY